MGRVDLEVDCGHSVALACSQKVHIVLEPYPGSLGGVERGAVVGLLAWLGD